MKTFRLSMLVLSLGAAVGAQAVIFEVHAEGTLFQHFENATQLFLSTNVMTITSQNTGGLGAFDSAAFLYYKNGPTSTPRAICTT